MLLCKVTGSIWGAKQADRLLGTRLLTAVPLGAGAKPAEQTVVVVDVLGAGPGDLVLVTRSSRCRDVTVGAAVPDKDIVVAIVDNHDLPGETP